MRNVTAGALLLALMGIAPADSWAASYTGFTSFWVLGDRLSDNGNVLRESGGTVPLAPYVDGRFSNGPVWAEHVAADFTAKGLATGNFAHGGASVGPTPFRPIPAPPSLDLDGQIEKFATDATGQLGARPVVSMLFGANDLFFNGIPLGTAKEVGRSAARGVGDGALELKRLGVRDVAIFNLPSLDLTPAFALLQPQFADEARKGTAAFNRTLDRQVDRLRDKGMNVIEFDLFGLFNELLADPQAFGVADAENPCYVPPSPAGPGFYCGDATAPLLAFFDPVHPNATIHRAIADVARGEIAPVPLPAPALLLLAGMASLAFAGLRRRQGSRIA